MTQSRAWLPNPIGGLAWYGVDDTYTTCYLPLYCGIDALPKALSTGSLNKFSWDSAWWVFNVVSNYSHTKYSQMVPEVQAAQKDIESELLALQPAVEKTALELAKTDAKLMTSYLTDYSVSHVEQTTARWRTLAEYLFTKYRDGYVYNGKSEWKEVGYPEAWLRRVVHERRSNSASPQKNRPRRSDRSVRKTHHEISASFHAHLPPMQILSAILLTVLAGGPPASGDYAQGTVAPSEPALPAPTSAQRKWQDMAFGMFFHWAPNVYQGGESDNLSTPRRRSIRTVSMPTAGWTLPRQPTRTTSFLSRSTSAGIAAGRPKPPTIP